MPSAKHRSPSALLQSILLRPELFGFWRFLALPSSGIDTNDSYGFKNIVMHLACKALHSLGEPWMASSFRRKSFAHFRQRGIYTTKWLEASSPQAILWSERLAHGRQNAHHSCPAGRDLCRADPSTRGATAPQRAQRVKFVRRSSVCIVFWQTRGLPKVNQVKWISTIL
ncbi:hypothetical protein Turpa_3450 [Turneriella parva DSM 21527]|uniref:Uncharacterized protein n=1 Tax=Turneriella parva (strain ATCC BAA-1111 / DSM 21527 / NCTC 11395 / H) TaxID=869212 RepID=I4B9Y0_TURPD|nr:hypothetical protein Turpa_3450 [Turneriella parva DSM 21527]